MKRRVIIYELLNMIEFSINKPEKGKEYRQRPGAYGIIKNADGLVAIIKTKAGYFLPGGGIEQGESPAECLKRECLEEIGVTISGLDHFASGSYHFFSTTLNVNMESLGYFFTCKIDEYLKIKTEDDHELVWTRLEEAIPLLYLENQREAMKIFRQNY